MNRKMTGMVLAISLGLASTLTMAQETKPADTKSTIAPLAPGMSYAMQKSMDPNVWIQLMNGMMSGQFQGQPAVASCAGCHTGEDLARYQKDYGSMLHAMNPMMAMTNPQAYGSMASGMMAPMTGMMGPMTGMMGPMSGMMMAPMGMMNPMMSNPMGMMGPMMNPMGMMGPMMNPMGMMGPMMNPMNMMNPMGMMGSMSGMMPGMAGGGVPQIGSSGMPNPQSMMDPSQYEKFYKQWSDMVSKMMPQAKPGAPAAQ